MGISNGTQPLPFGHSADAAVDIEGLMVIRICCTFCTFEVYA